MGWDGLGWVEGYFWVSLLSLCTAEKGYPFDYPPSLNIFLLYLLQFFFFHPWTKKNGMGIGLHRKAQWNRKKEKKKEHS